MKPGVLYGIGLGPGDPELVTVKAVRLIKRLNHIFIPRARGAEHGLAGSIVGHYLSSDTEITELDFPMMRDPDEVRQKWKTNCEMICKLMQSGNDVGFVTIGDPMVFSTYLYLLDAMKGLMPNFLSVTIPGISAFSAAASLTGFPLGFRDQGFTVLPTSDDFAINHKNLQTDGTLVFMKIGARLKSLVESIEASGNIDRLAFVGRAGLEGEIVLTDLSEMKKLDAKSGNLSVLLVRVERKGE